MGFNLKVIFDAWVTAAKPNEKQKELAEKRLEICMSCPSRKEVINGKKWSAVCGECGCPISKKIFAQVFDECPLRKWTDIDKNYFDVKYIKNKKTII